MTPPGSASGRGKRWRLPLPVTKVLIVDDDALTRVLLRRVLARDRDCQVVEADNGVAALDAIARDSFSFVLLDLEMPVMDGIQTLQTIRASPDHASLPVVILTAAKEEQAVRTVVGLGVSGYMTKPLKPAEISARLEKLTASFPGNGQAEAAQGAFLRQPALRVNLALAAQRVLGGVLNTDVTIIHGAPEADAGSGVMAGVRLTGAQGGSDVRFEMCSGMETAVRLAAGHLGRPVDAVRTDELAAVFQEIAAAITDRLRIAMRQRYVALSCSPPASRVGPLAPAPAGRDGVRLYLQAANHLRVRLTLVGAAAAATELPIPDGCADSAPVQSSESSATLSSEALPDAATTAAAPATAEPPVAPAPSA